MGKHLNLGSKDSKLRVRAKNAQEILDRCMKTIERETYKIERKSDTTLNPIDPALSAKLIEYVKVTLQVRKEEREQIKGLKLTEMSEDELISRAKKVLEDADKYNPIQPNKPQSVPVLNVVEVSPLTGNNEENT